MDWSTSTLMIIAGVNVTCCSMQRTIVKLSGVENNIPLRYFVRKPRGSGGVQ